MEKEIIINKEFIWNEDRFRILSLKNTNGKAVVKICKQAEKDQLLAAYEKEREYGLPYMAMAGELTHMQLEIRESVSPLSDNFRGAFLAGDQAYEARFFGTDYWDPVIVCREPKWQEYQEKLKKTLAFYGLDSSCGWLFISFACAALSLEELRTSRLSLSADKVVIPGETFAVNGPGEEFCFVHPLRNTRHTLKVLQYEKTRLSHEADKHQYPPYCVMMEYTVAPKLDQEAFDIRDCGDGDGPKPSLLFYRDTQEGRVAVSSMYEKPSGDITWRMLFYEKTKEDITIALT